MNITATIITKNEEKNIKGCIESLQIICDEIIVVDSESSDKTIEIAKSMGAITYIQPYLGDGPQKNFGVQYAKNKWILSIDADERIDVNTINSIINIDLDNSEFDAYAFKRKNFVGSHWIKAAGFYPDYVTRLYHKKKASYLSRKAHSKVEAKLIKKIPTHIIHYTYNDYTHWIERINQLSSRDAWAMYEKGVRPSKLSPFIHASSAFVRKFLFKGGMFQGLDGLTVTITTVFHAYIKYLKLLELYESKKP